MSTPESAAPRGGVGRARAAAWLAAHPAAWQLAAVAAASVLLYLPILGAEFVYDDFLIVLDNRWIRSFDHLGEIFTSSVSGFIDPSLIPNYYRPLIYVVYAMAYRAFWTDPFGYHLLNVLFNAAVGVAAYLAVRAVLRATGREGGANRWVPFVAALLFAAHPIHTEAVDFVGSNTELLFALFLLLSFWLYAEPGTGAAGVALSAACYLASALTKETGLTLPILLVLFDVAVRREPFWSARHLLRLAPYAAVTVIYFALRLNALGGVVPYQRHGGLGLLWHVANVFPLFMQYVGKLLLPVGMTIFYPFRPVGSLLEPRALAGLAVGGAFAAAWLWSWRRNATVNVALSLVWAPLLPVLYVSGVGESAFADRYLYVSSAGFALLGALGVAWAWARPQRGVRIAAAAVVAAVLALYAAGTVRRHAAWQTDLALWSDAAAKAPGAPRPIAAIGDHHYRGQRWDEAVTWYERAVQLGRADTGLLTNLGIAYARMHRFGDAERSFLGGLAIDPSDHRLQYNLGLVYASGRRYDEAIARFEAALRLRPGFEKAASQLRLVREQRSAASR